MNRLNLIIYCLCTVVFYQVSAQRIYQVQLEISIPSQCEEVLNTESTGLSFIVYPNPAASELTIVSEAQLDQILMYDVTGKNAVNVEIQKNATGYRVTWKHVSKGVYLLQVQQNGQTYVNQIVINP